MTDTSEALQAYASLRVSEAVRTALPDAPFRLSAGGRLSLPDGSDIFIRTSASQLNGGGVGFTVGSNVRDAQRGFLVFVHSLPPFAKESIRLAVVGLEEWAEMVDRYEVPEKPILHFGRTSLTLDYPQGRIDVSKWLENFGAITSAVGN